MISAVTQVYWVEWPCLALRCIISHRKVWQNPNLASLHIFCLTWEDTFHSFETLDNRNNILRQSINLDRFGRFVQLHKESVKHFLSMTTIMRCPTSNKPLLTFSYAQLCSIIVSDHHRHPNTERKSSRKMSSCCMRKIPYEILYPRTNSTRGMFASSFRLSSSMLFLRHIR